jgi:molybdopterin synthase catalytic subunit
MVGSESETIDIPDGSRLATLLDHYESRTPKLKQFASCLAMSINREYASADEKLKDGDEVALLPPVSGGLKESAERRAQTAIVQGPIATERLLQQAKQAADGALVVFEGIVRNQTRERKTRYLEYEAYEEMARKEMQTLAEQALTRFQVREVLIRHRLGRLEIGETSVLIIVASAHRAAAFEASRWLIDTLKKTVPIWKKEHFEDGAVWADGEPFPLEIQKGRGISEVDAASNCNKPK